MQVKRRRGWRISCDVGEVTERLENELCYDYNYELCSFSKLSVVSPTSQPILQPFRGFTYVTAHSPTILLLHLRHSSFSNPSFASPTSHALHLREAELILQPFRHFTYVTAHSPTLPWLYLRHSSFSNPSVASPTSQLTLQPFFRFSYVTGSLLTSPGEPPMLLGLIRFSGRILELSSSCICSKLPI